MTQVFVKTFWNKSDKTISAKKLRIRGCRKCKARFLPKKESQYYCTNACMWDSMRKATISKPIEKSAKKQSDESKRQRNKAIMVKQQKNDVGFTYCQECERSNVPLHLHHIIFLGKDNRNHPNINHIRNGILLCIACHAAAHEHKALYQQKRAIDRSLHQLFPDILWNKYV